MNELFSSVAEESGSGSVRNNTRRNRTLSRIVKNTWQVWCRLTSRQSGVADVPQDVRSAVCAAVNDGASAELVEEIARGAAKTKPHVNDLYDVRRLTSALTAPEKRRKTLLNLARNEKKPVIAYPDDVSGLDIDEFEDLTGLRFAEWTSADIEAAETLSGKDCDLKEVVDQAVIDTGCDPIHPTDVLKSFDSQRKRKPKRRGKNTYAGGVREVDVLAGAVLEADPQAERMLMRGAAAEKVAEFHSQAPSGYWSAVLDLLSSGISHDKAYDSLQADFGWHPSDRKSVR